MQAPFADPLSGLDAPNNTLPLVGRETEMQVIRAVLDAVALDLSMGARALTISGEMGIGKTRLLAEMCAEANARGFRILEGRTYEFGNRFPYFPFTEALRPLLRTSTRAQLRRWLGIDEQEQERAHENGQATEVISLIGTPLVASLAALFPTLPKQLQVTLVPEELSPDQAKFRLLDAVATLLERMAQEQPVLLCIDNLQWADSASLELTLYLTVRLHGCRVALAGVTRPPEMAGRREQDNQDSQDNDALDAAGSVPTPKAAMAATKALGELMRQGLLLLLPLAPLSPEAAALHIQHLLAGTLAGNVTEDLLARAGGNPFFLEELVRMLTLNRQLILHDGTWYITLTNRTELPASIRQAVGQRLQGRSAACRDLLCIAALFGRTFPLIPLVQVAGISEETVLTLMDEAQQEALIAPITASHPRDEQESDSDFPASVPEIPEHPLPVYMFCQGIVQEVLKAEVLPLRLRPLHTAIGTALESMYGDMAPAHAAELARHYTLGGQKAIALPWSLLAGEDAARKQAHREAIGHFRRVVSLLEAGIRPDDGRALPTLSQLYIAIGESWFKLGELEQAAEAFRVGAQLIEPDGASTSLQLAQANRLLADVYRMQGKYDQALAHLQSAQRILDPGLNSEEQEPASAVYWFAGRTFTSGSTLLARERVNATERILFLQAQATLYILLNRTAEAEKALWQSHQLAVEMGDRGSQAFALHLVGWLRGWGEHIHEAMRLQKQAHELYISIGDPFRATLGEHGLGSIHQALGEMETARRYTEQGIERARRYGVRYSLGWLYCSQGSFALAQGDWAASEQHLQRAQQEAEALNNTRLMPMALQAQAELQFRRGHWHEAEQYFLAAIVAAAATEWYPGAMALYGHFLAVTGRRAAARAQLDQAAAHVEPPGYGGSFYIPFLAEGYLHLEDNKRAATFIERIQSQRGFMYYGSSVDRILGVVAAQAGQWETAERAFEEALALCRRASNAPEEAMILYEQARASLLRSGSEPEREQRKHTMQRVHRLCEQAREIFLRYDMQRAVDMVNTLQDGIRQLEQREKEEASPEIRQKAAVKLAIEQAVPGYHLDLSLTKRELEVLRLVAAGHTDREVAETLVISPRTVNRHLSNIFVKLDVPGRAAAVAYAIRQGLV